MRRKQETLTLGLVTHMAKALGAQAGQVAHIRFGS